MRGSGFAHVDWAKFQIELLLQCSDKPPDTQSLEIVEFAYKKIEAFEEIAKRTLQSDLDEAIHLAVGEIRRMVEEIKDGIRYSKDDVEKIIHPFNLRVKEMEVCCVDGLYNSFPQEEEGDHSDAVSSGISCGGDSKSKIVGVFDVYKDVKDNLMRSQVTSLVGMPGIGKTTLVKKVFQDPEVAKHFDYRVWVRVGKKCRVKDIPRRILAEMDPDSAQMLPQGDEDATHEYLKARLESKRYLIVLDDVWDTYMAYLLHPHFRYEMYDLKHPFLHSESGSRILLTSRLQQFNKYGDRLSSDVITMRLLNKEESWDLLRKKVFSKGSCPPHLEKPGKKISEYCEGLPLTIVTVAALLSKDEESPEYWNEVAAKKSHQVFKDAYDEISKVLLPSYTYLPPLLQMCFLFMGLFPRNDEIPRSKLINIWLADGFPEVNINIRIDSEALGCLDELVSNNLVMIWKQSTFNWSHTVKTCGLHSSLWYLSNKKARETMFALVLSNPNDDIGDGQYRRLSFHNNTLFAIKSLHKSAEDNCASTAHSLLCYGPYHQYQVPICFGLKLLRELDALSIRFYEFPMEILQLVELRYLALTLNGMIPASISKLSKLQFLIADRHLSIKSRKGPSYLPVEIWGMKELKHLQVTGSDLPDPCGASLESLSTLLNVSAHSCTEVVLNAIPNLRELRIRIELAPYDDDKPSSEFVHISRLGKLNSVKCVVVNPENIPDPVVPFSRFVSPYLQNLSLSGLGYPWKEISQIASMPLLNVLKLKSYAFRGPEWEVERGFLFLRSLVIEDTDMVDWKVGSGAFPFITSIILQHCYKLQKIDGEFGKHLKIIEIVNCNSSCVEEIEKATRIREYDIRVYSSRDDGELNW